MSILVAVVVDGLRHYNQPTSSVRDAGEVDLVHNSYRLDPHATVAYVARRLTDASRRLRQIEDGIAPYGDVFRNARAALGTYEALLEQYAEAAA
jgi:hypothetical protein